ncbi:MULTISPECIES: restriction endonuclease subunit S [Marinomonas]|uniref:Restriction endonuclease subunit S n=1 Tax=Marinomonas rhodophyticola TaxID=2992803 RepID=A0ABT3KBH0_9GAMM|nr:restriction endonuclease subunit S [Marinomonas sp. KJ51-3]MCW4627879.1 restriction endonuclease subunit S [Marinomonas sp. KJ51-3]
MSELPKGWVSVKLESVVDKIVGGGTPSKSQPSYFMGDIPWMTVKDMNKSFLTDTVDHITQEAVENSSTNIIPAGTPIVATRMSLGKIIRASFDSAINQDLKALFINQEVNQYYFEHWYRSQGMKIESLGTGTTVKGIRLEVLKDLDFPLAPLAEQKRIVEKLDQVLAQVDTIKARLDGIPAILKRFRQSVLAAAVSGKLTEEWRGGVKAGYKDLKVDDIACKQRYSLGIGPFGSNLKVDDYESQGHPLVFVREIRSKVFDSDKTKFVSDSKFEELKAHRVKPGDILITKMGDPPGDIAIYPNDRPEAVITADCIKLTVNPVTALTKYVAYAMQSSLFQKAISAISAGVAQQKVNLKKFRVLYLPVPSLEEQTEIIRLVDQYFAFADTIEKQVQKAQQRVDKLTQSILAKAFRGELVPQDPTDEPADELLKRIAAARAESEALAKAAKKVGQKK